MIKEFCDVCNVDITDASNAKITIVVKDVAEGRTQTENISKTLCPSCWAKVESLLGN